VYSLEKSKLSWAFLVLSNIPFYFFQYLNYAQKNRQEWELKGQEVTAAMIEKYKGINGNTQADKAILAEVQDSDKVALRSQLLSSETNHSVDSKYDLSVAGGVGDADLGSSLGSGSDFAEDSEEYSSSSEYTSSEEDDDEDSESRTCTDTAAGVDKADLELLKEMQSMIENRQGGPETATASCRKLKTAEEANI
jgi:hypothetical protein